jgi:hypothetical protein
MSDETPKKRRRRKRLSNTLSVDTVLVQFPATMLPPDSPEFQERARRADERPIPEHQKQALKPDQNPPTSPTN